MVAHGVSRGGARPPSPPTPLPPGRERGAEGGVRGVFPRADALGYDLPSPGGWNFGLRSRDRGSLKRAVFKSLPKGESSK